MDDFECAMEYYNENYGSKLIFDEDQETFDTFVCPSCGEHLYFYGWENVGTDFWVCCPICGCDFFVEKE